MTQAINTPAKANDLKLVVRNTGTNGKKIKIDRVYVVVTYSTSTSRANNTPLLAVSAIPVMGMMTVAFSLSRRLKA